MKIEYSPDAADRLRKIKMESGSQIAGKIMKAIRGLGENPRKCPSVEKYLGVICPYYFLHVERNYVFYRIEDECVLVTDIYNEREDYWIK